jgi:hypothetical protein
MLGKARVTLALATLLGSAAMANAQTADMTAAHHPNTSVPGMMSAAPTATDGPPSGGMAETGMGKMMSAMRGMMAPDHVEGRIAYQKAALAITDAPLPQWTAVADALRQNAKSMDDGMAKMSNDGMPTATPARGDMIVMTMSEWLEGMKKLGVANKALYAVLTPTSG